MAGSQMATSASPNSELRRREVLDAAAALFAQQGYDNTSIIDIAVQARMKKASLYHYFPSKRSILIAVLHDGIAQLWSDAADAAGIDDPEERLSRLLSAHLRNFQHKLEHVAVFLFERRALDRDDGESGDTTAYLEKRRAYDRLFVDVIREGQASGAFRDGDPIVMAYAVLGMLNWMVQWFHEGGQRTLDQIADQLHDMAMASVHKA